MKDKIYRKIAWMLPGRIAMWGFYRVLAYATSGKYEHTNVPDLTAMDAVDRWIKDHEEP